MKWLSLALSVAEKIPFERLLVKPPNNKKALEELQEILSDSRPTPVESALEEDYAPDEKPGEDGELQGYLQPRRQKMRLQPNPAVISSVSTKETVDYQNREIGKVLLTLQRHCVQKFRINGKACDCGQTRHLLELEALVEEVEAMVEDTAIYDRILDWIGRLGPVATVEAVSSGQYDELYQEFGNEAREIRKELLGTLDPKSLFPPREGKNDS